MSHPPWHLALASVLVLSLAGCAEEAREGDVPGQCSDGQDNDGDGWIDCDEPECLSAAECGGGDDDDSAPGDDDDTSGGDDDTAGDDDDVTLGCPQMFTFAGEPQSGVTETLDLGGPHGCVNPWCGEEYLDFHQVAPDEVRPISAADLSGQIQSIEDQELIAEPPETDRFASEVIEALRICFLLEGLEERSLEATIVEDHGETQTTRIEWILLTDPMIGTIRIMLLFPVQASAEPLPVILAVHGHGTEAGDFVYAWDGPDYPDRGYVLAAVDMRANGGDQLELDVGWHLLLNGFTLQGLHIYEIMVAHKYLRTRLDLDSSRIGLLGQSAGSMKSNALIRVTDSFAAYVSDNFSEYTSDFDPAVAGIEEDTIPNLYPYTDIINDFTTATIPVLKVDYGYPDGTGPLLDFFDQHLAP
jgi:hypothetical protein